MSETRTLTVTLTFHQFEILWSRFVGDDGATYEHGCPVAIGVDRKLLEAWRAAGEAAGLPLDELDTLVVRRGTEVRVPAVRPAGTGFDEGLAWELKELSPHFDPGLEAGDGGE